jgi:hypothetical protein
LNNPFLALGAALLWLPLAACNSMGSFAFIYSADAIEGWVADAETGKPLEEVIVVAHWRLKGGFEGGTPIRELQIFESVTDHSGRYYFPSWGPKFAFSGYLGDESPGILLFKQGYKFQRLMNDPYMDENTSRSQWNKKTVKVEPFTGTLEQYSQHLFGLNSDLWTAGFSVGYHSGDFCGWKSFPKMLRSMDELREKLEPLHLSGRSVASQLRSNDTQLRAAGCGTVTDLIGK